MVCIFPFNYPDAGRVAPISACVFLQRVSGNLKCNKNGRAFDADFEHPAWKGKSIKCAFGHFIIHHYSELILGQLVVIRTVYIVNGSHKTCFITYNYVLWTWQNSKLWGRPPYIWFINYGCENYCKWLNINDNAFWKVYILVVSPFIRKFLIVVLQCELSKNFRKQNHTK